MELPVETLQALATPVGTGTVLWFFVRNWMKRMENLETTNAVAFKEIKESITQIRLELAEAGIKRTFEEVERLKEKAVRMEGQIHAAWKALDRLGGKEPRLSDDLEQ